MTTKSKICILCTLRHIKARPSNQRERGKRFNSNWRHEILDIKKKCREETTSETRVKTDGNYLEYTSYFNETSCCNKKQTQVQCGKIKCWVPVTT